MRADSSATGWVDKADDRHRRLLWPYAASGRASPRSAEQRDELAPSCMSGREHCDG